MAKTRSMTRNHNHDDDAASIRKWFKICDNCGLRPWSDLNHDVLFLVMMQLGVIDFLSFSGVCKSRRSFALSKRTMFLATKPPMFIRVSPSAHKDACYLIDFDERKFKTIIPQLVGRTCLGLTCGYLILYGSKERDIWLVNPITRHQLHFPDVPFSSYPRPGYISGILVFSPSISEWVFVMIKRFEGDIWFSISGKGAWNHVLSNGTILGLHAFKGKIYILNGIYGWKYFTELRLNPEFKMTSFKIKNHSKTSSCWDLLSFNEKLYLIEINIRDYYMIHELDFEEMKWVSGEKKNEEYAFFLSNLGHSGAFKQEAWADPCSQYGGCVDCRKSEEGRFFIANMWYFPHDCLNVNCLDE